MSEPESKVNPLDEANRQLAVDRVNRFDPGVLEEVSPLVLLERSLHLGVNANGDRLTGEERQVLQNTLDALRQQLADTHVGGDILELGDYLAHLGLNQHVKNEIYRRLSGE